MSIINSRADFEKLFLPHLDAAYNLARLLTRNPRDAEDMVQESYLKAWRSFSTFSGTSSCPWILAIVRNTCLTFLRDSHLHGDRGDFQKELHADTAPSPEAASLEYKRAQAVEQCVQQLPPDFREALVLREMEDLSYEAIAQIIGVPRGIVMSRLSSARVRMAKCFRARTPKASPSGRNSYVLR